MPHLKEMIFFYKSGDNILTRNTTEETSVKLSYNCITYLKQAERKEKLNVINLKLQNIQ